MIDTRVLSAQLLDLYQTYTISTPVKLIKRVMAFFHNPSQQPDMDSPMRTFWKNLMKHVPIAHCTKMFFILAQKKIRKILDIEPSQIRLLIVHSPNGLQTNLLLGYVKFCQKLVKT